MHRAKISVFLAFLFVFNFILQGQLSRATLTGTVKDTSGAAMPGATVTLKNSATGSVATRTTDANGNYTITDQEVGHYSLTVSLAQFKTVTIPDLELQVGQVARVDPVMEVGSLTEQVTITTAAPLISTASSDVGQVVDRGVLNNIPLNGRAFWQLTQLTPGATYTPAGSNAYGSLTSIRASAVNVVINGSDPDKTGWILDGSSIIEVQGGGTEIQPNVDALEEFKVESGNMTAEFGRTPTTVTAVIKSGTNQFHGDLFEFLRNDTLDSRNFFFVAPAGTNQKKDILKRNQFGGTIGGPIVKDKTFFFADMEETMVRQAVVASNVVPSLSQRQGDFSGSKALLNPFANYAPFAGNQIPASLLSPQGSYFLNYLPQPNFQQGNTARAVFGNTLSLNTSKADLKIDENITTNDHLMGRYSIVDNTESAPDAFPALGLLNDRARGQDFTVAYTHVFSPKWLNEARIGYYRMIFLFQPPLGDTYFSSASEAGYQGFDMQLYGGFPQINMSGYSGFDGAPSNQLPKSNHIRTYEYADTLSYSTGRHEIKAGMQLYHNTTGYVTGGQTQGIFNFLGTYSGNSFGDFLLGLPDNASRDPGAPWWGDYGNWPGLFVQDNYRVTDNLTLNLGLRFEVNGFYTGVRGQTSGIDLKSGNLIIPSSFDVTARPISAQLLPLYQDRIQYTKDLGLPNSIINANKNWAPRIGFAWKPFGSSQWVLRGGYGVFYDYANNNGPNNSVGVPPNTVMDSEFNSRPPTAPARNWSDFFLGQPLAGLPNPNPGQPCAGGFTAVSCSTPSLSSTVYGNQSTSHQQEWNFTLQRQIASDLSLTVAYVGNISRNQVLAQSVNDPSPAAGAIQTRRPLLQWGKITNYEYDGSASYNALQVSAVSRTWRGLSLLGNYTFSKCMDNGSGGSGALTASLIDSNRAVCNLDRTNSSAVSFFYELPFGTGRQFLNSVPRWANQVVGGWRISGVLTLQSGLPFTPVISGDRANTGVSSQRPDAIAAPVMLGNVGCWFYVASNSTCQALDPTATATFTTPAQYTYGNAGRDILRADGLETLDFSILKNFDLSESKKVEFRAECFNLANHPVFSAPSGTVDASSGGQVSSLLVPARQIQLALKFYF